LHHVDKLGRLDTVKLNNSPIASYDNGVGPGGPLSLGYANQTKATYTYDSKLRQTGIDVQYNPPGSASSPVTSFHEAFGADSISRIRQLQIGAGGVMTDVFLIDGAGRVAAENLLVPNVTLPQIETVEGREVLWPFYLDIEPMNAQDVEGYVRAIGDLLQALRQSGVDAVPSCDFEDDLPH
jgi:hypothetical protein